MWMLFHFLALCIDFKQISSIDLMILTPIVWKYGLNEVKVCSPFLQTGTYYYTNLGNNKGDIDHIRKHVSTSTTTMLKINKYSLFSDLYKLLKSTIPLQKYDVQLWELLLHSTHIFRQWASRSWDIS